MAQDNEFDFDHDDFFWLSKHMTLEEAMTITRRMIKDQLQDAHAAAESDDFKALHTAVSNIYAATSWITEYVIGQHPTDPPQGRMAVVE